MSDRWYCPFRSTRKECQDWCDWPCDDWLDWHDKQERERILGMVSAHVHSISTFEYLIDADELRNWLNEVKND